MTDIDFRRKSFTYYDSWRRQHRTAHFKGRCIMCGRRTYSHEDGEDDPRGVLGDHAAAPLIAEDYNMVGPDIPACFLCMNDSDEWKYKAAFKVAQRRWKVQEDKK